MLPWEWEWRWGRWKSWGGVVQLHRGPSADQGVQPGREGGRLSSTPGSMAYWLPKEPNCIRISGGDSPT